MTDKEYPKRRNSLRYGEGDYSCPDGNYYVTICVIADIDLTEAGVVETVDYTIRSSKI